MSDGTADKKRIEELEIELRCVQADRDSLRAIYRSIVEEQTALLKKLTACEVTNRSLLERVMKQAQRLEALDKEDSE